MRRIVGQVEKERLVIASGLSQPLHTLVGEDIGGIPIGTIRNERLGYLIFIKNPLVVLNPRRIRSACRRGISRVPAIDRSTEKSIETIKPASSRIEVA